MNSTGEQVVVRLNPNSLDDIPLGIVLMSLEKRFIYTNRAAREAVGPQLSVGTSVADVFMDDASRHSLEQALDERFISERGSDYQLTILRRDLDTKVRIKVWAVPSYSAEGRLEGSIGFLANTSLETSSQAIHCVIGREGDWTELLRSVAHEVRHLLAFDSFAVSVVSENRRHLRQLFAYPPDPDAAMPHKWWPMPPFVRKLMEDLGPSAISVEQLFRQPGFEELKHDDLATKKWLARGFKHILRLPVRRDDRIVAVAALYRKTDQAFSDDDIDIFSRLPIAEAVNMALAHDQKSALQFSLDLVRNLSEVADSIRTLAERLVNRLREHYEWEHVSLFQVDEDRRQFKMLHQSGCTLLPSGYAQPFGVGLLGRAHENGHPVNAGKVYEAPWADIYVQRMAKTKSEMCLPIPGSKVRWLLNAESTLTHAFADEEQHFVELLLKQAGLILDRAANIELQSAILRWIADAVVQTTTDGSILDVNPATENLLKNDRTSLKGRNLADYIHSEEAPGGGEETIGDLLQATNLPPTAVTLRCDDDSKVPALISGASLPAELGGRVYVLTDLTLQRRIERMDLLRHVFRQFASETRLPLSLAAAFLADAAGDQEQMDELVDKARKQIAKADLPLERMLRLASAVEDEPFQLSTIDLGSLLRKLVTELPSSMTRTVRLHLGEHPVSVKGAPDELEFCVQNLIAFLLRHKAECETVDIRVSHLRNIAAVSMGLHSDDGNDSGLDRWADLFHDDTRLRRFEIGEPVLENLMRRMGGSYQTLGHGSQRFRLTLQFAESGHGTQVASHHSW